MIFLQLPTAVTRPEIAQSLSLLLLQHAICAAGDLALLEQVKQLIPRLTYQQIQDNPFADGVSADVSEDAQDIVPLVVDSILSFCCAQLCDFTSAFAHGTRMMKGVIEVLRIGLLARGDPTGIAQVRMPKCYQDSPHVSARCFVFRAPFTPDYNNIEYSP